MKQNIVYHGLSPASTHAPAHLPCLHLHMEIFQKTKSLKAGVSEAILEPFLGPLQRGKLHFGVILGWNVVAAAAVWFVVNHLAALDGPGSQGLGGYDCCCLLGYCQVPLLIYALLNLVLPR